MIIYNVTTKVHESISEPWLTWMKEVHIPEILGTGCFSHAHILRLLETDDSEGPTYAVQFHCAGIELYDVYITSFAEKMLQKAFDKWGNGFISFKSVLEVVN